MAQAKKKTAKKKTSKKKVVKKKAGKKQANKSATKATKKAAPKKKTASKAKIKVTHDQHYRMVCEAAYYISLDKSPETVNPTEDWLQAEAAINRIYTIVEQ